jgi:hypothetical protein
MPLDLALSSRALEGTAKDIPEKRLAEMSALSEAGEFSAAAARAATALADGVTDVRVLGYFWFGVFLEQGPASIAPVLSQAAFALGERWDVLRPEARRDRIADGAISAMLRLKVGRIDFHAQMRDATFRDWMASTTPELSVAANAATSALRDVIEKTIERPRATEQLSELENRIATFFVREAFPEPAPRAMTQPEAIAAKEQNEEPAPPRREPEPAPEPKSRTIEVSPALEQFMRKLEAFERLVTRGDMNKAAIVADDVRRTVESFNPRVFLPKLLTPHYRLLAGCIGDLTSHWEEKESPQWQVLEQLYQVDLDAFLDE